MRSNLPLWQAFAFHELSPFVAILVRRTSQPYQWRGAFAGRTSLHGHWTMLGPRGAGGWTRVRHIWSPEKKNRCSRRWRRRSRRKGRQWWARTSCSVRGWRLEEELLCQMEKGEIWRFASLYFAVLIFATSRLTDMWWSCANNPISDVKWGRW